LPEPHANYDVGGRFWEAVSNEEDYARASVWSSPDAWPDARYIDRVVEIVQPYA
jgi:hypothetical protein